MCLWQFEQTRSRQRYINGFHKTERQFYAHCLLQQFLKMASSHYIVLVQELTSRCFLFADIKARYENGVLKLDVPKRDVGEKTKRIEVS